MNANLKNSQTKENLMKAFAGESQARNRYTFAAAEARRQNLYSIGHVFEFTAEQERAHAERFYELLKCMAGETIEINAGYPVDKQSTIIELLESSQHKKRMISTFLLETRQRKKGSLRWRQHSFKLQRLKNCTEDDLGKWLRC